MPVQAPESPVSGFGVSPFRCIIQHIRTVHFPVSCGVRTVLIVRSALCAIQRAVSPLSFAVIIPYPVMEGVNLSLPGVARVKKNQTSGEIGTCRHTGSGRIARKYKEIPELFCYAGEFNKNSTPIQKDTQKGKKIQYGILL